MGRCLVVAVVFAIVGVTPGAVARAAGTPLSVLCELPRRPAGAPVRGLVRELPQYPDVAGASRAERAGAARFLADARRASERWRDPRAAVAAGFAAERPRRPPGSRAIGVFHAEHRRFSGDRRFLDPRRPEVLIYANAPGRRLVLVGVMFSLPRGVVGASPGGSITRWHHHLVCVRRGKRGLAPRRDGTCPPGATRRRGSDMMHVWFTRDLRSAFAIRIPEPELCALRLLPAWHCAGGTTLRTM